MYSPNPTKANIFLAFYSHLTENSREKMLLYFCILKLNGWFRGLMGLYTNIRRERRDSSQWKNLSPLIPHFLHDTQIHSTHRHDDIKYNRLFLTLLVKERKNHFVWMLRLVLGVWGIFVLCVWSVGMKIRELNIMCCRVRVEKTKPTSSWEKIGGVR